MNQQLKTRLVGAVVLISLAVIFIPMLLDGGGRESSPLNEGFIPDRPGYHFEPLEIPLKAPPPAPAVSRLVDPPLPSDESMAEMTAKPPEPQAPKPAPSAPVQTAPAPAAAPAPAPAPATAPVQQVGWVVQVGSFSRQENALGLRDRLRSAGYTSFVDRASNSNGTVWRVRVGPELQRERAERLQQRLQSEMQLSGLVMSHGS